MEAGEANINKEPLVEREKIILPQLHIKLGQMKQFVQALNKDSACSKYLYDFFPSLSTEKLKAGIFNGPQIRQLIASSNFTEHKNDSELAAWSSYVMVIKNLWQLRARLTLLDVVQFISHTKSGCFSTCFIDSAIFYLFPILSHVFRNLFIISSSVLEQAGFSEIEGVISSNPTWQCLHSVFFVRNINSRACLKYTILFSGSYIGVLT